MSSRDTGRRAILATVVSGLGATAGCLGFFSSEPNGGQQSNETPHGSPSGGASSGANENGTETSDGSGEPSVAAGGTCSSLSVDDPSIDQVVCDGKQTDAEVHLSAERDAVSLPKDTLKFTLANRSRGGVSYTPCRWVVYEKSNGGWKASRPLKGKKNANILKAGITQTVTLTLYVGRNAPSGTEPCGYSLDELDAGRYLFGVTGMTSEGKKALFLASFRAKA